jgi:hypothetical protein
LPIVFYDDTGATHDLSRIALSVDLAQSRPGAEDFGVADFDEVDLVLATESRDQLDVFGLRTCLHEHAKMRLTLVQSLGTFTKSSSQTIMTQRDLQDFLHEGSSATHEIRVIGEINLKSILY